MRVGMGGSKTYAGWLSSQIQQPVISVGAFT